MAWVKVSDHLEMRKGNRKTSYRVNFRQGNVKLRQVIRGASLAEIRKEAQRMIYEAQFGPKKTPANFLRNEEIARQLVLESGSQKLKTQEIKALILEKHLTPWLNECYPYAQDLTVETWPKYKAYKRAINPTIALENHVKYFRMLRKRAFELGALRILFPVKFDLKKEEFRAEGQVIPKEHEAALLAAANTVWRDRSILQRDTGMRPGEVRLLKKERVRFEVRGTKRIAVVELVADEVKTHRDRSFEVHSDRAVEVLFRRFQEVNSPYFFKMETDRNRPMDKHLNGWKSAIRKANKRLLVAGLAPMPTSYTPHDWRHTYADEMFKCTGPDKWASLSYQLDMSLETAMKTYIHFKTSDTQGVAEIAAASAQRRAA